MNVKVKARSTFYHGNVEVKRGEESEQFSKAVAHDLEKNGLVEIVGDASEADTKMADAPENKMADAPANKSRAKKAE